MSTEEEDSVEKDIAENKNGKIQVRRYRKKKGEVEESTEPGRGPSDIKSVMFWPYTAKGELAK